MVIGSTRGVSGRGPYLGAGPVTPELGPGRRRCRRFPGPGARCWAWHCTRARPRRSVVRASWCRGRWRPGQVRHRAWLPTRRTRRLKPGRPVVESDRPVVESALSSQYRFRRPPDAVFTPDRPMRQRLRATTHNKVALGSAITVASSRLSTVTGPVPRRASARGKRRTGAQVVPVAALISRYHKEIRRSRCGDRRLIWREQKSPCKP